MQVLVRFRQRNRPFHLITPAEIVRGSRCSGFAREQCLWEPSHRPRGALGAQGRPLPLPPAASHTSLISSQPIKTALNGLLQVSTSLDGPFHFSCHDYRILHHSPCLGTKFMNIILLQQPSGVQWSELRMGKISFRFAELYFRFRHESFDSFVTFSRIKNYLSDDENEVTWGGLVSGRTASLTFI